MALSDVLELVDKSIFEAIHSVGVAEGYIVDRAVVDLEDEVAWAAAEQVIITEKGYVVDLEGASNSHEKGKRTNPSITYDSKNLLNGNIGNAQTPRYEDNGAGGLNSVKDIPQTSDYLFYIHVNGKNSADFRTIKAIVSTALAHNTFIPVYNDPGTKFLIVRYGYQDNPDHLKGSLEGIFMYKAMDILESLPTTIATNIVPINEIDVELEENNLNVQTP
jgi:hypothetical protein